ncbi:MAG: serine/threonine-protein kinase, partial [Gemmatimonadota bacterium]
MNWPVTRAARIFPSATHRPSRRYSIYRGHLTTPAGSPPVALVAALAARYRIERELGRGGMATVYLAHDLKHKRPVALKVLHPDLAATLGPERFQREIETAAQLQHPHILTVHDSGDDAGHLWFTMPFVEGESLRGRLERERQLPVADAVRIAREAAQALEYAHRHGIIHRDIKPENLLLTEDGNTLVADFGIARSLAEAADQDRLTQTGMSIGTAAYMSPEQAAGERQIDARSDVYSLGAVTYEMLAGEPPFTGPTAQAIIAKRFAGDPPPVRRARPTVPEAVDAAVQRALAAVPADRYASAAEFARALAPAEVTAAAIAAPKAAPAVRPRRRAPVALVTMVIGFAVGLGVLFAWRRDHGADAGGGRRLAVLPFENQGAASDDYFADGLTEEVRGKLTALPGLRVTASTSSSQYRKSTKSLRDIAAELGVDYLLVGKVRWEKRADGTSRVRVSPELIDARSGEAKWQEPFDAALTDVFQVQSDIASRVAGKLDVALTDSVKTRLEARPTKNLAAYDAYLRAKASAQNGGFLASLRVTIAALEQAVALDPEFADAWADLGTSYASLYTNGGAPTPELARAARRAIDRSIALAPSAAAGYMSLAFYYRFVKIDADSAQRAIEVGLRLDPSNPKLLGSQTVVEILRGQWDSALVHATRMTDLDPRTGSRWALRASVLASSHRLEEARAAADRALQLMPMNST